jgi:hypothetical protein
MTFKFYLFLSLTFITLIGFGQDSTLQSAVPHTGDEISYVKHVQSQLNLQAAQADMNQDLQGNFFVEFYVETNGDLSEFNVSVPIGPQFDKEILRILDSSPAWTPAKMGNKYVRQPMSFLMTISYD